MCESRSFFIHCVQKRSNLQTWWIRSLIRKTVRVSHRYNLQTSRLRYLIRPVCSIFVHLYSIALAKKKFPFLSSWVESVVLVLTSNFCLISGAALSHRCQDFADRFKQQLLLQKFSELKNQAKSNGFFIEKFEVNSVERNIALWKFEISSQIMTHRGKNL